MNATREGSCSGCRGPIHIGEPVLWAYLGRYHPECVRKTFAGREPRARRPARPDRRRRHRQRSPAMTAAALGFLAGCARVSFAELARVSPTPMGGFDETPPPAPYYPEPPVTPG